MRARARVCKEFSVQMLKEKSNLISQTETSTSAETCITSCKSDTMTPLALSINEQVLLVKNMNILDEQILILLKIAYLQLNIIATVP